MFGGRHISSHVGHMAIRHKTFECPPVQSVPSKQVNKLKREYPNDFFAEMSKENLKSGGRQILLGLCKQHKGLQVIYMDDTNKSFTLEFRVFISCVLSSLVQVIEPMSYRPMLLKGWA